MVQARQVNFDQSTGTVFILFEENTMKDAISNASEYEVFVDDLLYQQGITKIIAVEVDVDRFDVSKAVDIPEEYRSVVHQIHEEYKQKYGSIYKTA